MIKRADITARFSDSRDDGLCAEFDQDGNLTHLGHYQDGSPSTGCMAVDIDPQAKTARAARSVELSRPIDDPEGKLWLRGLVSKIADFKSGEQRCSFCQEQVAAEMDLIAGPGVNICDKCVELSLEILIEADRFSRSRMLPLLLKKRGTNRQAASLVSAKGGAHPRAPSTTGRQV